MRRLKHLFENNRHWAESMTATDAEYFKRLTRQQKPEYLWIGCADSRVPANEIVGMAPGELFVHRNVANNVVQTDMNMLSVLQFAVEVLKVKHVIVCGHYGCGGVIASMRDEEMGLIDNWLRNIKGLYAEHHPALDKLASQEERENRMCELNVWQQVVNVCNTTVIRGAWRRGQEVAVHGWIYSIEDGLLRNLDLCVDGPADLPASFELADRAPTF